MKKRKNVPVLLSMVMIISLLAGCGTEGQQGTSDKTSGDKEKKEWKYEEVTTMPVFEDCIVENRKILDTVEVKVATTPLNSFGDISEMYAKLGNHDIMNNYTLSIQKYETISEAESYVEGAFHDYKYRDRIIGYSPEADFSDFELSLLTDYGSYTNVNSITVSFSEFERDRDNQKEIKTLLADLFNEEIADILVYSDNNNGWSDYEAITIVETPGSSEYAIYRKGKKDSVTFTIEVNTPGFYNQFRFYDGGQVPMAQTSKYKMSDLTNGNVSDIDFQNFRETLPEVSNIDMGRKFYRNRFGSEQYREQTNADGSIEYYFSYTYEMELADMAGYELPEISLCYDLTEKEGVLTDIDVEFSGEGIYGWEGGFEEEKTINTMKEFAALFVPEADLSGIVYDSETDDYEAIGSFTYLGLECQYEVDLDFGTDEGKWKVSIKEL